MKKFLGLIIITLCLLLPMGVKADLPPLSYDSYANGVSVGSTVTYKIQGAVIGDTTNLNGKITYDSNQLEFVEISTASTIADDGDTLLPEINIVTNEKGAIEYKITNEYNVEGNINVLITFKVKSIPTTGELNIRFYGEDKDSMYGNEYHEFGIEVLNNDSTNDNQNDDTNISDEENDNTNVSDEENDNTNNSNDNQDEESNDLYLYLLIASVLINIALIIILVIKSTKKVKVQ